MIHEREEDPHVGGSGGASSQPTSDAAGSGDEHDSVAGGDIEIPLGVPVSEEEFRRMKEAAKHPGGADEEDASEQAQEDEGRDDLT
jgi:hypothetical protein